MWRDRGAGRAAVLGAAAAVAVAGMPGTSAAPAFDPVCTSFALSPTFATDRTAACTYTVRTSSAYRLSFAMTVDGGRSWRPVAADGLTSRGTSLQSFVPTFSPRFAADRTILVGTDTGLHVSRDAGQTWTVVDPTVRSGSRTNPAPFVASPSVTVPGLDEHLYAAFAGDVRTARIDVTLGLHQPAAGTPGDTAVFVPYQSGSGPDQWRVVALGTVQQPPVDEATQQYTLYRCSLELSCVERLHTFPPSDTAQIWAAPNGVLLVQLARYAVDNAVIEMWRSTDHGATFTRWESVDAILAPSLAVSPTLPNIAIATHPRFPRLMYLRVATSFRIGSRSKVPQEQLWRSDDAGLTWRRIGYQLHMAQPGRRGSLPFAGPALGPDLVGVYLAPDGRLFAVGSAVPKDGPSRMGLFCSLDGGRRWGTTCAR